MRLTRQVLQDDESDIDEQIEETNETSSLAPGDTIVLEFAPVNQLSPRKPKGDS